MHKQIWIPPCIHTLTNYCISRNKIKEIAHINKIIYKWLIALFNKVIRKSIFPSNDTCEPK